MTLKMGAVKGPPRPAPNPLVVIKNKRMSTGRLRPKRERNVAIDPAHQGQNPVRGRGRGLKPDPDRENQLLMILGVDQGVLHRQKEIMLYRVILPKEVRVLPMRLLRGRGRQSHLLEEAPRLQKLLSKVLVQLNLPL